ncbi:MAG TPA: hypothetical protein VH678_25955 [Xanthobacteraceae bacterium]|jgi:hypothetical protein
MPRYFFHVQSGVTSIDREGTKLRDLNVAREEALCFCGEILRAPDSRFWNGKQLSVLVTDQPDAPDRALLAVNVSVVEQPAYASSCNRLDEREGNDESAFDNDLPAGREIRLKRHSIFARRTRSWYQPRAGRAPR